MNEASKHPEFDPQLEARLVAMIVGEASDFEREELNKLIVENPQLAELRQELEGVHALLTEAGQGDLVDADDEWKLSPERRTNVLGVLRGETKPSELQISTLPKRKSSGEQAFWRSRRFIGLASAAAAILVMLSTASWITQGSFHRTVTSQAPALRGKHLDRADLAFKKQYKQAENTLRWDKAEDSGYVEFSDDAKAELPYTVSQPAESVNNGLPRSASLERNANQPMSESLFLLAAEPDEEEPAAPAASEWEEVGKESANYGGFGGGYGMPAELAETQSRSENAVRYRNQASNGSDQSSSYYDSKVRRNKGKGILIQTGPGQEEAKKIVDNSASLQDAEQYASDEWFVREQDKGFAGVDPFGEALPDTSDFARPQSGNGAVPSFAQIPNVTDRQPGQKADGDPVLYDLDVDGTLEPASEAWADLSKRRFSGREARPANGRDGRDFGTRQAQEVKENSRWGANVESFSPKPLSGIVADSRRPTISMQEKRADDEAFSTFSLHVSDVSFKLARAALSQGEWPEAQKLRIEEFVNAFDYGDPLPTGEEKVACCIEQTIHPFLQQRNLLRVSMRTAATGRSSTTPLRLTFLLDNSGSMERADRRQTVRRAFALLADQLQAIDQVTLITFARTPRLVADNVPGTQAQQLVRLVDSLPSEGGTNIEAAVNLAFEKARQQQIEGAQNRIILLTDGAVNLGNANPQSLSRMISRMREHGIAFDAAGISADGLNDEVLEALTRKGDGRYYLLDSAESVADGFAKQLAGALRPSARNVKVQVEFNPKRVGRYKLLGFEKHRLKKEDFRNDQVDAAEMAAAEAGVAMYQFEAKPDGEGDVGSVSVRFRDLQTGQMVENRWPIPYQPDAPCLDQASPSIQVATSAALLAAKLRGDAEGQNVSLRTLSDVVSGVGPTLREAKRVGELEQMIKQARQIVGE